MRVIDKNGYTLDNPDLLLGRLVPDRVVIAHHEAQSAIQAHEGEGHYSTVRKYPNGGMDVEWVWDVEPLEAVPAKEAYDEYEAVLRYIPYTQDELERNKTKTPAAADERLYALLEYVAMMADIDIEEV